MFSGTRCFGLRVRLGVVPSTEFIQLDLTNIIEGT